MNQLKIDCRVREVKEREYVRLMIYLFVSLLFVYPYYSIHSPISHIPLYHAVLGKVKNHGLQSTDRPAHPSRR